MIRSRACHFAHVHRFSHRPPLILSRRVQTLPNQDAPPKSRVPPPPNGQKPHVQLRPGPIKSPKNTSSTPPPVVPTSRPPPPQPTVQTAEPFSLTRLKETTAKDIADAESHGILAPPPPGAGWAKSTLHKAIQIAKFYYRGVKLIYSRSKVVRDIKQRVATGGAPLERWEFRMIYLQDADMKRLVPFVIIALIVEEAIPLIAIWYPEMLPSTCILPSQRERMQKEAVEKSLATAAKFGSPLRSLARAADNGEIPLDYLAQIHDGQMPRAFCGLLHLSPFGINAMRTRRIRRHLTFVAEDDAFLAKEDLRSLSASDLLQALHERGIDYQGLDHAAQVQQLSRWLKSVNKNDSVGRRLYLVSSMGSR